jgi:hypothetical protein
MKDVLADEIRSFFKLGNPWADAFGTSRKVVEEFQIKVRSAVRLANTFAEATWYV